MVSKRAISLVSMKIRKNVGHASWPPFFRIFMDTSDIALFETIYDIAHFCSSFSLPATTFGLRSAARRRWIHDLHDPRAARKLRANRASRRTARIYTVQCGGAF